MGENRDRSGVRSTRLIVFLLLASAVLCAKRLPIRTYTSTEGLASDDVFCIHQDSHGFLWFCTSEGLSRFDGYSFTNYTAADGLPSSAVREFLQTRRGDYWIATSAGVVRFDPRGAGKARFVVYPLGNSKVSPAALIADHDGGLWCGTLNGQGVFYLAPNARAFHRVAMPPGDFGVTALLADSRGALWVATTVGLFRRDPDGAVQSVPVTIDRKNADIMALLEDRSQGIWIGTRTGLVRMDDGRSAARIYGMKDGLPIARVESLLESADGKIWVGTADGLAKWTPGGAREFESISAEQGLNARAVAGMAEDRDGNLWMGTFGAGAMKLARNGFTTYTPADGVPLVQSFALSRQGELGLLFRDKSGAHLGRFDGERFSEIRPAWPRDITYFGWGRGQQIAQDSAGEWWIATGMGLCRFAPTAGIGGLTGAAPKAVYRRGDGLPGDEIFTVFADSKDRIWIGTIGLQLQDGMALWDRKSGRLRTFSSADGLPIKPVPAVFAEDHAGDIWAALYHGGLARYREGRFTVFGEHDGFDSFIEDLLVDSAGRLWVATSSRGVIRIDQPAAEHLQLRVVDAAQGLSSNHIKGLVEDRWGRIYVATGRGIDRFTPRPAGTGPVQRYTTADGLAPGGLDLVFRDRQDNLWFSTDLGLSQFIPVENPPPAPPPVLVTGLSVGGVTQPLSDLGQTSVSGLRFPERSLRVDYVGLGFRPGLDLRYQYMLEGADHEWSAPTEQRSVIYASLTPGSYRFRVRAVVADTAAGPPPATVQFRILPPVWRTWWFLLACGTCAALLVYTLHRYRVAQAVAVADVRTRIATDLHDDIGASLSQIAVLSEVARGHNGNGAPLAEIAGISRELVDSMSDIVWAINPDHDRLSNLVHRMRRFATDLLGGQGIALVFRSSILDGDLRIGANVRRQVYLIFKEAVHNAARHSGAHRVEIALDREGDRLALRITDDGCGFDPGAESEGNGLASIRRRAGSLGGQVEWQSSTAGTILLTTVQLDAEGSLATLRGRLAGRIR